MPAAEQAARQKVAEICAIEFGVAGGSGLVAMQEDAAAVERDTGIAIKIYGFDMGVAGLPEFIGDYRDHPDVWQPGDYPMDEKALRRRLGSRTTLVIGNLKDTVPDFVQKHQPPPIGFISIDVDLYSSARDALALLAAPDTPMLWHVPVYLDDVDFFFNHCFAGELLAVHEFNATHAHVKIDRWHGLRNGRPFPERSFIDKFYVAHNLVSASSIQLNRVAARLALQS